MALQVRGGWRRWCRAADVYPLPRHPMAAPWACTGLPHRVRRVHALPSPPSTRVGVAAGGATHVDGGGGGSPVMQQYFAIKHDPQFRGHLVLFQLGQFMEAFFADAAVLASTLNIVLTQRGSHAGGPIPMSGIPMHSRDAYLSRLMKAGLRVVLCEQVAAAGSGGGTPPSSHLMRREVTRVVTPGTWVPDTAAVTASHPSPLPPAAFSGSSNGVHIVNDAAAAVWHGAGGDDVGGPASPPRYLAAVTLHLPSIHAPGVEPHAATDTPPVVASLSWCDVSTGDCATTYVVGLHDVPGQLAAFPPAELVVPPDTASICAAYQTLPLWHKLPGEARRFVVALQRACTAAHMVGSAAAATWLDAPGLEEPVPLSLAPTGWWDGRVATPPSWMPATLPHLLKVVCPSVDDANPGTARHPPTPAGTTHPGHGAPPASRHVESGGVFHATDTSALASLPAGCHPSLHVLLSYVLWTQQGGALRLQPPRAVLPFVPTPAAVSATTAPPQATATHGAGQHRATMHIDAAARRALELTRPQAGRRRGRGSLLHALDNCTTAAGSRLLDARLSTPLTCAAAIATRLDAVQALLGAPFLRHAVRRGLARIPDMERCVQRIAMRRRGAVAPGADGVGGEGGGGGGSAVPPALVRDLMSIRDGIRAAAVVGHLLLTGDLSTSTWPLRPGQVEAMAAAAGGGGLGTQWMAWAATLWDDGAAPGAPSTREQVAVGHLPHLPTLLHLAAAICAQPCVSSTAPTVSDDVSALEAAAPRGAWSAAGALWHMLDLGLLDGVTATGGTPSQPALPLLGPAHASGAAAPPGPTMITGVAPAPQAVGGPLTTIPWVIQPGYSAELDAARSVRDGFGAVLQGLQDVLRAVTGIKTAKVKRTEEHGWVLEVAAAAATGLDALPAVHGPARLADVANPAAWTRVTFHRVRSLKATVRFKCDPLRDADHGMHAAVHTVDRLEAALIDRMCSTVATAAPLLSAVARAAAVVDVAASHAELAHRYHMVRPQVMTTRHLPPSSTPALRIRACRHLVVERALLEGWAYLPPPLHRGDGQGEGDDPALAQPVAPGRDSEGYTMTDTADLVPRRSYVPNDVVVGGGGGGAEAPAPSLALLTGANMGGKSTWLRSAAHAVIMAHMGAYVPAAAAEMHVVDAVFARIGAADDLARDRSTFLVEMSEMAAITTGATRHSFVVIDELGRGTSSVDGLALAWACVQHLVHAMRCRTLFATHMHELVPLAVRWNDHAPGSTGVDKVACHTMEVVWEGGDELVPGEGVGDGAPPLAVPTMTHRILPVDAAAVRAWAAQAELGPHAQAAGSKGVAGALTIPHALGGGAVGMGASLGIHIARVAGLPPSIVAQAHRYAQHAYSSGAAAALCMAMLTAPLGQAADGASPHPDPSRTLV